MEKQYISAGTLLAESYELALRIAESGFRPELVVGVWRGGSPVGIAVQEALEFMGHPCDHIAIRTASYRGIAQRGTARVSGLDYLNKHRVRSLLIVDDVYDTGLSLQQVITELEEIYGSGTPDIRIATVYFKPANNKTSRSPDYYLHETSHWLVFPHELAGLSDDEIRLNKADLDAVIDRLLARRGDAS